ncbi:MAG TPA: hypothetical protein VK808_06345 [Bacteroidia bacterium]|nr:hypothetical protein [Bacteroidia bacterium]
MSSIKIKKKFLLILIGVLVSFHCFSQLDTDANKMEYPDHSLIAAPPPPEEIFYKGSLQAGGGIAFPVFNKALRESLNGVYNLHLSGNYVVAQHIYLGLELEDTQLGNTASNASFSTEMFIYNVGLKFGYYTYMQNDFLICYSLSAGPSESLYSNVPAPSPKGGFKQMSYFMTPNMLIAYRVNNELRIGLDVSIIFMTLRFNTDYLGISQLLPDYSPSDAEGITVCAQIGFGLYWAFDEGKRK